MATWKNKNKQPKEKREGVREDYMIWKFSALFRKSHMWSKSPFSSET